jgi:hypothetical protein
MFKRLLLATTVVTGLLLTQHVAQAQPMRGDPNHHLEVQNQERVIIIALKERNDLIQDIEKEARDLGVTVVALIGAGKFLEAAQALLSAERARQIGDCYHALDMGSLVNKLYRLNTLVNQEIPRDIGYLRVLDGWEEQYFTDPQRSPSSYGSLQRQYADMLSTLRRLGLPKNQRTGCSTAPPPAPPPPLVACAPPTHSWPGPGGQEEMTRQTHEYAECQLRNGYGRHVRQ